MPPAAPTKASARSTDHLLFAGALFAMLVYLVLRNRGLYPMVFADEWLYSQASRLQPLSESILPSYLFLALYRVTSICGANFLECARLLNALWLVGAAPFLYLIARPLAGRWPAMLVALLAIASPVNSFTVYFMPESMYLCLFYALAWSALNWRALPAWKHGLLCGAVLGLMALVKVHALFLAPALLAWFLYAAISAGAGWLLRFLTLAATSLAAMLAVRLGGGLLLAGPAGMQLLGAFYGAAATNGGASSIERLLKLLPSALFSARGHALALGLLIAVPCATLALHAFSSRVRRHSSAAVHGLQVFAVLMLGAALGLTVMFTASIGINDMGELVRLHQRYYSFVFPLFFIIAVTPLGGHHDAHGFDVRRAVIALLLAALVLGAIALLGHTYRASFTDAPELAALTAHNKVFYLLCALTVGVLAQWVWQRRLAALQYLCVLLPLTMIGSEYTSRDILARAKAPSLYDSAGKLAHKMLAPQDRARLTVVGEGAGLSRALFHIDTPGADLRDIAPGAPITAADLSPRRAWYLIVGDHALPAGVQPVHSLPGVALVKVDASYTTLAKIEFSRALAGGVLTAVEGMPSPEGWGAWSVGPKVVLHFARPLPAKLSVLLSANAIGPNIGKDFIMQVGAERKPFRLEMRGQDRLLNFDTDGKQTVMTIEVPQPVSPSSLGMGGDDRLLGIAITTMEIGAR